MCERARRSKRAREKMKREVLLVVVFSPQFAQVQWRVIGFLPLCRAEERFSSSLSRVFLPCSSSRKSWGSTSNLSSYCSPTVIHPTSDPLSWPLFQISARHFSMQGKEINSAAMGSTLVPWTWGGQHVHKINQSTGMVTPRQMQLEVILTANRVATRVLWSRDY